MVPQNLKTSEIQGIYVLQTDKAYTYFMSMVQSSLMRFWDVASHDKGGPPMSALAYRFAFWLNF